jgi:hypothetical protein
MNKESTIQEKIVFSDSLKNEQILIKNKVLHEGSLGMEIIFDCLINQNDLKSIKNKQNQSLFLNLKISQGKNIFFESKQQVHINSIIKTEKGIYFKELGHKKFSYQIPYYLLEKLDIKQSANIRFEIYTLELANKKDSPKNMSKIIGMSKTAMLKHEQVVSLEKPTLLRFKIETNRFKLNQNSKKYNQFDFSMGGSGLPDLYLALENGSRTIAKSELVKNSLEYNQEFKPDWIYCTEYDIIKFTIADEDIGPFNTKDDLIFYWEGKYDELAQLEQSSHLANTALGINLKVIK